MKTCTECNKKLHLTKFIQNPYSFTYTDECRKCYNKITYLRRKYNLQISDVQAMYLEQFGRCKICSEALPFDKVNVDHCHSSGKIRGLLCSSCNKMLGFAKDNIKTLEKAIKYLEIYHGLG